MMTVEDVVKLVQTTVPGAEVFARDLTGTGDHFEAFIVSSDFVNKSRLQRHQQVLQGVQEAMKGPLHAFTFKTYTPEEWEKQQG